MDQNEVRKIRVMMGAVRSVSGVFSFHGSDGLGYGGAVSATEGVWTSSSPAANSAPSIGCC
jgi:hypothetical protein